MRFAVASLTATLLTGSLAACSSGYGVPLTTSISAADSAQTHGSVLPVQLRSSEILAKVHARAGLGADAATFGIYALVPGMGSTGIVYGYPFNDRSNGPPVCSVGPLNISYIDNDIAVDRKGDLLVTETGTNTIKIFKGPGLCGPELGSISDPFGVYFEDVASRDGETIVAAYDFGRGHNGVAVCTLSGGCTRHLHTPGWAYTRGVAVAPNGDCWASGDDSGNIPGLAYFAHCRGNGVLATGFKNGQSGGLDIDAYGNLVSISSSAPPDDSLYIYSGCNPACTLVGGPFQLKGSGFVNFGHLDGGANKFVAPDGNGNLDIYSYSPSAIHYLYSITNGTQGVYAAAFSPNSKE